MTKVILTEQQLQFLMEAEKTREFLLKDVFANTKSGKVLRAKIRYCFAIGISAALILSTIIGSHTMDNETKKELTALVQDEAKNMQSDDDIAKVEAVKGYINYALGKKGYSMKDLRVTPSEFVNQAKKHNYDLPLLLAQCHLESCFGMTPRARKTNSIFSIGSYDNGSDRATYTTQDDSIEDYIRIMQNDYFRNGAGVSDILKQNALVNANGDRYASDKNYEAKLRYVRNNIIKMYPELK